MSQLEASQAIRKDADGLCSSPDLTLRSVASEDLACLCAIEKNAHAFAWDVAHFRDCLTAGYPFFALVEGQDIVGYYVAMRSLDELHLLNITVDPAHQRRGFGRMLMHAMMRMACSESITCIWLEARQHNAAAIALYRECGFEWVARRKDYYPAHAGTREDAWVMKWHAASLLELGS